MAIDFNPLVDMNGDDTYTVYRQLRDESPVHWSADAGMFCVSRYAV